MKIRKVLLVDDDEAVHFLCKRVLLKFNSDVETKVAFDGSEALHLLDSQAYIPDVIFLDINMAGMGGIEFLESYRKKPHPDTNVVVLSSSENEKDRFACKALLGTDYFISKPLSVEILTQLAAVNS